MPPENQPINISQPPADSQSRQSVHGLLPSEMRLLNHDERIITVAALLALAILAFPDLFSSLSENSNMLLTAGIVLAMTLVFFILFLATYIYRQSKLIVTDQNLIQILQGGLFSRKISRLSVSNVEDVTAEQHGFLPTIFNYGTLIVETAGEMKNFIFPYCPNPNTYADQILDARQAYADRLSDDN
jgi:membrane protein YdbS with pleckstrin-like domain